MQEPATHTFRVGDLVRIRDGAVNNLGTRLAHGELALVSSLDGDDALWDIAINTAETMFVWTNSKHLEPVKVADEESAGLRDWIADHLTEKTDARTAEILSWGHKPCETAVHLLQLAFDRGAFVQAEHVGPQPPVETSESMTLYGRLCEAIGTPPGVNPIGWGRAMRDKRFRLQEAVRQVPQAAALYSDLSDQAWLPPAIKEGDDATATFDGPRLPVELLGHEAIHLVITGYTQMSGVAAGRVERHRTSKLANDPWADSPGMPVPFMVMIHARPPHCTTATAIHYGWEEWVADIVSEAIASKGLDIIDKPLAMERYQHPPPVEQIKATATFGGPINYAGPVEQISIRQSDKREARAEIVFGGARSFPQDTGFKVGEWVDLANKDDTGVKLWLWRIANRPPGSQSKIIDPTAAHPGRVMLDAPGEYTFELMVNDGHGPRRTQRKLFAMGDTRRMDTPAQGEINAAQKTTSGLVLPNEGADDLTALVHELRRVTGEEYVIVRRFDGGREVVAGSRHETQQNALNKIAMGLGLGDDVAPSEVAREVEERMKKAAAQREKLKECIDERGRLLDVLIAVGYTAHSGETTVTAAIDLLQGIAKLVWEERGIKRDDILIDRIKDILVMWDEAVLETKKLYEKLENAPGAERIAALERDCEVQRQRIQELATKHDACLRLIDAITPRRVEIKVDAEAIVDAFVRIGAGQRRLVQISQVFERKTEPRIAQPLPAPGGCFRRIEITSKDGRPRTRFWYARHDGAAYIGGAMPWAHESGETMTIEGQPVDQIVMDGTTARVTVRAGSDGG